MNEILSCRVTLEEKRLAQALAEHRNQYVAGLLRELLRSEIEQSFQPGWQQDPASPTPTESETPGEAL